MENATEKAGPLFLVQPWTLWITGLSGSGKTTISKELLKILAKRSITCHYLRLDDMRQFLTPNPTFSKEEKGFVYRAAVYSSIMLNSYGINALIDSVDGQGEGRRLCHENIQNFAVVAVECPLEECIRREQHRTDRAAIIDLYQRAFQGELKLAGMGEKYYEEKNPMLVIDSFVTEPHIAAAMIAERLR